MTPTAIAIFSDPRSGTDEALGRVLNGLILAQDLHQRGAPVAIIFQGAGVRWAGELVRPEHPVHGLFVAVQGLVAGVCGGCADVFGAATVAEASGLPVRRDQPIPGTSGVISLASYLEQGYRLVIL